MANVMLSSYGYTTAAAARRGDVLLSTANSARRPEVSAVRQTSNRDILLDAARRSARAFCSTIHEPSPSSPPLTSKTSDASTRWVPFAQRASPCQSRAQVAHGDCSRAHLRARAPTYLPMVPRLVAWMPRSAPTCRHAERSIACGPSRRLASMNDEDGRTEEEGCAHARLVSGTVLSIMHVHCNIH